MLRGIEVVASIGRARTFNSDSLKTGIDAVLDDVATLRNYRAGSGM
jgi:hypothetical protein